MFPVVFDSLIRVLKEEKLDVEYIRFPCKKLSIYLSVWRSLEDVKPINLVKAGILNFLAIRNREKHKKRLAHMEDKLVLGGVLSGNMSYKNVTSILPNAARKEKKKKCFARYEADTSTRR